MVGLIIFLVVVGVILYFLPIEPAVKALIYKVLALMVIVLVLVWLLGFLGIWHRGQPIRV